MRRVVSFCIATAIAIGGAACGRSSAPPSDKPAESGAPGAASATHDPASPPRSLADWARGAQLFQNLGTFHRQTTTSSAEAQRYLDQGMRLLWAFHHDESTRSFAQAAALDPSCAMCFWGAALTVGPNYNVPVMAGPRAAVAWDALQHAQQQAARATPVEQALIAALAKRYTTAGRRPGPWRSSPRSSA